NDGDLINNVNYPSYTIDGAKIYEDGTVLAYAYGYFKKFQPLLTDPVQYPGYHEEITDFDIKDNNLICIIYTAYFKMFPESSVFAQTDAVAENISPQQTENTFYYSGEGTSKAIGNRIITDSQGNSVILSKEWYGEEITSDGASTPFKYFVYKYDADLNFVWKIEIPYQITSSSTYPNAAIGADDSIYIYTYDTHQLLKISPAGEVLYSAPTDGCIDIVTDQNGNINVINMDMLDYSNNNYSSSIRIINSETGTLEDYLLFEEAEYIGSYMSPEGDYYLFFLDGRYDIASKKIKIYKNFSLLSSTDLNVSGQYSYIITIPVSENGTLYFLQEDIPSISQLCKLNINGSYQVTNIPHSVANFKQFNSGKVLTFYDSGDVFVYDENLIQVASNSNMGYYAGYSPTLRPFGNYMLLGAWGGDYFKVISENAALLGEFEFKGILNSKFSQVYQNNLLTTGDFGNGIVTEEAYQWDRGFVHKYDLAEAFQQFTVSLPELPADPDKLTIYPNPASDYITIAAPYNSMIQTVKIFDISGKLVKNSEEVLIDISELASGLFIVKAYTYNRLFISKFIKR
ncbi:T9SS type A sorting domain-containing protein, partial [Flavobacterium rhizosphaerae]